MFGEYVRVCGVGGKETENVLKNTILLHVVLTVTR